METDKDWLNFGIVTMALMAVMAIAMTGIDAWHKSKVQDCTMSLYNAGKPMAEIKEICK